MSQPWWSWVVTVGNLGACTTTGHMGYVWTAAFWAVIFALNNYSFLFTWITFCVLYLVHVFFTLQFILYQLESDFNLLHLLYELYLAHIHLIPEALPSICYWHNSMWVQVQLCNSIWYICKQQIGAFLSFDNTTISLLSSAFDKNKTCHYKLWGKKQ